MDTRKQTIQEQANALQAQLDKISKILKILSAAGVISLIGTATSYLSLYFADKMAEECEEYATYFDATSKAAVAGFVFSSCAGIYAAITYFQPDDSLKVLGDGHDTTTAP